MKQSFGNYKRALAELNEAQKEAVLATEGPVLVVAGPGTGKTQLLSTRVAHILKFTDTAPGQILCLTFTNKAALNMQQRIIDLVGADGARVVVNTFHSFAGEIMASYPDYFWNAARLSASPEAVQLSILESIASRLPLDNPLALKFAGQYTLLDDIQKSIDLAKDSGLTPEKLKALVDVNLAYLDRIEQTVVEVLSERLSIKKLGDLQNAWQKLPEQKIDHYIYPLQSLSAIMSTSLAEAVALDLEIGKTTHTGEWKKRWVQTEDGKKGMFKERRRNIWWLELAAVYKQYRQELHARGFYDYADMLVETISQLEANPDMLADIQERFSYVMIDEFQDTNPAQLRLAHLIADHHTSDGSPNLLAVGDDDQSIFKFNGAELSNTLNFSQMYPGTKLVVLSENYRSGQGVLDQAEKVIEQASTRLVHTNPALNKKLVAKKPPAQAVDIKALIFETQAEQLSAMAREIKQAFRKDISIAVLARSHKSLIKMAGLLGSLGVPIHYEQQANILEHEVLKQVYLCAKLAEAVNLGDKRAVNACLQQLLRHPAWNITAIELWRLAVANHPNSSWLDSLLKSSNNHLKVLAEWFIELARLAPNQPLSISLEQILGLRSIGEFNSPLKDYFTSQEQDPGKYLAGLSAIQLLRSMATEFGRSQQANLADFCQLIDLNLQNQKVIADETSFVSGEHAVNLLTVYKAKGLEFDQVYIIDVTNKNWSPREGGRKAPANLPLVRAGEDLDDYARLMYVAITRARYKIRLSTYSHDEQGQAVAISSLLQTAFKLEVGRLGKNIGLVEVLEENLAWPALDGGDEKAMLKTRLETFSLNPTSLLNFLDVSRGGPAYFKERNLLRLPEAKTGNLSYGTAFHEALQTAQHTVNSGKLSLAQTKKAFSKALVAEQLPEDELKRYETKGFKAIDRLFNQLGLRLERGAQTERPIAGVRLGQATIGGKLDRLDINDSQELVITDYKTGRALNSFETKDKNQALKAYKHKKQLVFYALLGKQLPELGNYKHVACQMIYVEAGKPSELVLKYKPTNQDLETLERLIEAVWLKIISLDLPDTSDYSPDINGILKFEQDLLSDGAGR